MLKLILEVERWQEEIEHLLLRTLRVGELGVRRNRPKANQALRMLEASLKRPLFLDKHLLMRSDCAAAIQDDPRD